MSDAKVLRNVRIENVEYPLWCNADEQRRAYVLQCLADSTIEGKILRSNCHEMEEYLRDGGKTPATTPRGKPDLKPVS
jgi:hypothetical protein